MKRTLSTLVQTLELIFILLLVGFTLNAGAQERATRQATDAEVTAAADVKAYINPRQQANSGGGGTSNGLTQAQITLMFLAGTNNYKGTNSSVVTETVGSMILTNSLTNLSLTASTDLEANANRVVVSLANGLGVKTNNGSGAVGWTTHLLGTWIEPGTLPLGTINSNLIATVSGGANITVTPAPIALGGTNFTAALADPASLGQINVGTAWLTNMVTPTNTMGGTAIDFAISEVTTNMAGNMVLSSVANLTAGAYNRKIIHCLPNGADRTITIATGWGQGLNDTFVVTNGTRMDLLATCQPGVFTNVFQKIILTH